MPAAIRANTHDPQGPPRITGLSADLVPPALYATRRWYYATPKWYYHAALPDADGGTPASHGAPRAPEFYELIDPGIRELCRLINEAGLRTTPSCEGHFHQRPYFADVWNQLLKERLAVQTTGLEVLDSETGERFDFRDPTYQLPWPDFERFFAEAGASQGTGYLGIVIPPQRARLIDELTHTALQQSGVVILPQPQLDRLMGGRYFGIAVQTSSPVQRAKAWERVTDHLQGLLNRAE